MALVVNTHVAESDEQALAEVSAGEREEILATRGDPGKAAGPGGRSP